MMADENIKNSNELEFAVFCIENVATKLGVDAERVLWAFTEKSDILNGYIVPEYEALHTQSREYIVDDLLDVMKERGVKYDFLYHGSFLDIAQPDLVHSRPNMRLRAWLLCHAAVMSRLRSGVEIQTPRKRYDRLRSCTWRRCQ